MTAEKTASFIVPIYNERENIPYLVEALDQFAADIRARMGVRLDAIFVDDGSSDGSRELLLASRTTNLRVRVVRFSRNFGKELALSAGIHAARADAVILMDADLQHPLSAVSHFLEKWLVENYDVVYGYRADKEKESVARRIARRIYYKIINTTSDVHIPPNVGDFQLMSRRAYEALRTLGEHERFMKGLYRWIGFRQIGVPFVTAARRGGESKYSAFRLLTLGIDGITSFSTLPLRLTILAGLVMAVFSAGYGLYTVVEKLLVGVDPPGYPTIITIVGFVGAMQLIFLGMIGEYLGKVLIEVKQRPLYLVESDETIAPLLAADIEEPLSA